MNGNHHRAALVLALAILLAPRALADGPRALYVDGEKRTLESGLEVSPDGAVWISEADLRGALGFTVKRLIPRPPEGRRRPSRERDAWILCGRERCATYRGETRGTDARPAFDLRRAVRAVGYRLRTRGEAFHVSTSGAAKRAPARARIGSQVGDLVLPDLEGKPRTLSAARGRRLLIVAWGTWSTSRDRLEEWRTLGAPGAGRALDLWFVAVDIEGARRVRGYAPAGATVLVDRNADLLRRLHMNDAGHWFLLDELGILRAEGSRLGEADRVWLDQHLKEPLLAAKPPVAAPAPRVALEILRERVAAEPENVGARLALAEALASSSPAEARAQVEALVKLKPRSVPFAFRLARMHLDAGAFGAALRVLDDARRRMPNAWVLRKQYWALEEPARFYSGAIDLAWQKQKRKEERAWADPRRRR